MGKIQKEGVLLGKRTVFDEEFKRLYNVPPCTYLTPDVEEAKCYGDILLEVEYDPFKNPVENNYIEGCWQFRVYEPIPIKDVRQVNYD